MGQFIARRPPSLVIRRLIERRPKGQGQFLRKTLVYVAAVVRGDQQFNWLREQNARMDAAVVPVYRAYQRTAANQPVGTESASDLLRDGFGEELEDVEVSVKPLAHGFSRLCRTCSGPSRYSISSWRRSRRARSARLTGSGSISPSLGFHSALQR